MASIPAVRLDGYLKGILADASRGYRASWAIVRDGAVAEFSTPYGSEHEVEITGSSISVSNEKGSMGIDDMDGGGMYAIVAENAEYRCTPWTQCIYLCIHRDDAAMSSRSVLTYLGHDPGMEGHVWDIGIGNDSLDVCIIVRDDTVNRMLGEREGRSILSDRAMLNALIDASPYRLFKTRRSHILVKQRIGMLEGAHTHLMPDVILKGIRYPTPVPEQMRCIIQVDPFASLIDASGRYNPWSAGDDPFQMLLSRYSREYAEGKHALMDGVSRLLHNHDADGVADMYARASSREERDMMRVALAQLACDLALDQVIRDGAVKVLEKIRAVNLHAVRGYLEAMRVRGDRLHMADL
ncbi:MAG: hypothetical protein RMJ59_06805 [Candidatus Nitrosocaldus sp.]|nr:hypothetical protein [Candidatus Nitrosocaldus sp.]MDW8276068.1 hypothetical protein [Candidatus Nitrosocaldus sp.]